MKPLIVGVDPGSTSAVAALNFEGNLELLESGKNFPPRQIISELVEEGKPVIVGSDKSSTPSKVEKIANSVGAEIFEPVEDLSQERKRELGEGRNSHEQDASAAAIHAFKQLRDSLDKIEKLSDERDEETSDVALRYFSPEQTVTGGKDDSEDLEEQEANEDRSSQFRKKAQRLEEQVKELEKELEEKEEKLQFREQQRRDLQSKYDKLKAGKTEELLKDEKVRKLEEKISEKDKKIDKVEEKLEKALVREKQYRKAIKSIQEGAEIVPLVDDESPGESTFVTRSKDLRDRMRSKGSEVYHVQEVEGIELGEKFILEETDDGKDIIQRYRDSR